MSPNRKPVEKALPVLVDLPAGTELFRIHSNKFSALEYNPNAPVTPWDGGRFDSEDGSYAFLYAGADFAGAAAEVLLRDIESQDLLARSIIPRRVLKGRSVSTFEIVQTLRLVK